jgi:hypothetical protein
MSNDTRDRLEILKAELDFIEKGGYGRPITRMRNGSRFATLLTNSFIRAIVCCS